MINKKKLFFLASLAIAFMFTAVAYSSTPADASDMKNNTRLSVCEDNGYDYGIKFFAKDNFETYSSSGGAVECGNVDNYPYAHDGNMKIRWDGSPWLEDIWNVYHSPGVTYGVESAQLKVYNWGSAKTFHVCLFDGVIFTTRYGGTKGVHDRYENGAYVWDIEVPEQYDDLTDNFIVKFYDDDSQPSGWCSW